MTKPSGCGACLQLRLNGRVLLQEVMGLLMALQLIKEVLGYHTCPSHGLTHCLGLAFLYL